MDHALATAQPNGLNRKQRRQAARQATRDGMARGAIASPPGGDDLRVQRAIALHGAGDLDTAEALYREVLTEQPDNARAQFRLGALLAQRKRHDEALSHLERARDLAPGFPSTYNNLAAVYSATGREDEARDSLVTCLKLNPKNADVHKNLGNLEYRLNNFEPAVKALKRGLELAPDDAPKQRLLAFAYAQLNRIKASAAHLSKAVAVDPENGEYRAELASLLHTMEDDEAALPHIVACFSERTPNTRVQRLFLDIILNAEMLRYMPELDRPLVACFESEALLMQRLALVAGRHLVLKHYGNAQFQSDTNAASGRNTTKMHLEGILGDRLLVLLLQKAVNIELNLELLLVPLRRQLLATARAQGALSPAIMLFMASLAMQCHNNAYIFFITPEENAELEGLAASIDEGLQACDAPTPALEVALALYAMYRPLHSLAGFEKILAFPKESWSSALGPLVELSLVNPKEEEALKATIPTFGSIQDATSQAVRSQYEENPYPRWTTLPEFDPGTFRDFAKEQCPWLEDINGIKEPERALIAGCGTGRHPIYMASRIPNCPFTAADLSLSSLAYAKRMAKVYKADNLSFHHGDLLDVAELGDDFDFVDSTGVLHHMRNPEEGLESLVDVLRPGGILRLGLYSQLARQWITKGRERIKALGLEPTAETIRKFRQDVLFGRELSGCNYNRFNDFYDLDSFRDLAFHVQEHQYTIPRLETLLARHRLEFLGFITLRKGVYEAYRNRFPKDPVMGSLENWHAFEVDNPDTFASMYNFWCRKPE